MSILAWLLLIAALGASAYVIVQAFRRPILLRMAARNVARRPRQTAMVIAGLMIGTAIISASLVAGQSAGSAIRGAVFQALGETDETIRIEGFPFWPEAAAEDILADPDVAEYFDAAAPFSLWPSAADHPRRDLFEPSVTLMGFDPARDAGFGDFELRGGGRTDARTIGPDEAIITAELADALEADVGDTITLAYTLPVDPLLPEIKLVRDALTFTFNPGLVPGLPADQIPVERDVHTFDVPRGTRIVSAVLLCGDPEAATPCPEGTSLRLMLTSPDGRIWQASEPVPPVVDPACANASCPRFLWLNATSTPEAPFAAGKWSMTVSGNIAVQTPYVAVAASLVPVYDLEALQRRAEALERQDNPLAERVGDLDLFGQRSQQNVTVIGVTDGGRGDFFDLGAAVFVDLESMQGWLGREGQINFLKFSNPGGQAAGREGTDEAVRILNATLEAVRERYPNILALEHLEVNPVKQEFLDLADEAGELMTQLLIFAGSLTIITGLLLIINIFTMLAEERRSELGMARAVGLTRRDLVRLFLFEGSLYAAAAAFIGALLGLLLAYALIAFLNSILAGLQGGFPAIPFTVNPSTIPLAFAAGLLLTLATIAVASRRIARLNIVRAIRLVDEPEKQGRPWLEAVGWPVALLGVAVTIGGWVLWLAQNAAETSAIYCDCPDAPSFSMQVFGALATVIGMGMALRRRLRRRVLDPLLAGMLAAYYIATFFSITKYPNVTEASYVGPVRGVLMTLAIVVVVSYWRAGPRALGVFLARFKRLRAVATPAFSYPQHKRFRTGMTLAMFSIVVLSIGFFSIFGALFEVDPARHTGGFDVEATTTLRVPDLAPYDRGLVPAGAIASQHRVIDEFSFEPDFITVSGERTGQFGPPGHHVYGVDQSFIDAQEFKLLWTLDDLSEDETYQRLLSEPGTVIVSYPYSTDERGQDLSHEVGEKLHLHIGDCTIGGIGGSRACPEYTIIGIQEQYHFIGIFLPAGEVEEMFPQASDLYLFKLNPGEDAVAVAKDLERNYREIGMNAEGSKELVEKEQETFRQILGAMKLFLSLGLIVGVLSLGIVTSRSVLERRQEIGMLRAIGYTRHQVRRIFLIEVSFTILLGFIIGFLCSIIVTAGLWVAIIRELQYPYVIPWLEVLYLFSAAYVVAMLATLAPIMRVGKVAPAEALRYVE